MKCPSAFFCGLLLVAIVAGGCSDPLPPPDTLESPQSVYSADVISRPRANMDTPLLIQLDESLNCSIPGKTTSAMVSWNVTASGATGVHIFVRPSESSTQAKLWTNGSTTGLLKTPPWVVSGMVFELRNPANQEILASETISCK